MKGINCVHISGDVTDRIQYGETSAGTAACSFWLHSDRGRHAPPAYVKVNAYGEKLVGLCRRLVRRGSHVLIDGELMNRRTDKDDLIEVRMSELFVYDLNRQTGDAQ